MRMRVEALFIFLVIGTIFCIVNGDPVEDKQALLDFLHNVSHTGPLNWSEDFPVCGNWTAVICNKDETRIIELHLPGAGLLGPIPPNTLSRLSSLSVLSLRLNSLTGPFPSDFAKLGSLTSLYLQSNKFSGPLPVDFSVWKNLTALNLSNNAFSGSIPSSISNLTHLTYLSLANNSLSGEVPNLNVPSLQKLDLANNNLTGCVPMSLLRFPSSAFSGNNLLTPALPPALPVQPPSSSQASKQKKLGEPALLGIVIGGCVLGFVVIAFFMIICCSKKLDGDRNGVANAQKKQGSSRKGASGNLDKNNRLTFFEGSNFAFDLEDLLRASAEVLGKGTFGTSYKAALEDTNTVVVKRLKDVCVGKKEFEQHMQTVGSISHENVTPLRAYYYSKDEKLVVYDYFEQGSTSVMLHGRREGRPPLDWDTRLKIAVGAARGIAHIHTQNGGKFVHGNIKASNVFLNLQGYGCVSDVGLPTLMSPMPPPAVRNGGYRAPEVGDTRKCTPASDVYSFGVLLFELLTGKSPIHTTGGEEVVHLVRWVNSVVREEWTGEVFDVELLRYNNIEEEMVELLQIGMACVARMPEQRPKMLDVVKQVEEIRQVNTATLVSQPSPLEISTPAIKPSVADIGLIASTSRAQEQAQEQAQAQAQQAQAQAQAVIIASTSQAQAQPQPQPQPQAQTTQAQAQAQTTQAQAQPQPQTTQTQAQPK